MTVTTNGQTKTNGFQKVLSDDNESLKLFLKKMAEFDQAFCEAMVEGSDYTLRLEVRGNKHKLLHVRLYKDNIEQTEHAGKNKR